MEDHSVEYITIDELRARRLRVADCYRQEQQALKEIQARLAGYPYVLGELDMMIEELEQRIAAREHDEQQLLQLERDAGIASSSSSDEAQKDVETPPAAES